MIAFTLISLIASYMQISQTKIGSSELERTHS